MKRAAGTIVTFYGGELKNKIQMFIAFGSDFAPAGPSVAFHSPLHTIDAGMSRVLGAPSTISGMIGLYVQLLCFTVIQAVVLCWTARSSRAQTALRSSAALS